MKLLTLWAQSGRDPDAFWRQTPRMLAATLAGYRAARKFDQDLVTHQARLTAVLHRYPRNKLLPTLDELTKPAKPNGRQSTSEMLAAFQDMQAAGAPIRIRKVA
jgi:hypothetical protein